MIDWTIVDEFHRAYYDEPDRTFNDTRWLGVAAQKYPADLWVYQEIICELRPDVIVETGTNWGGSALFMASICELLGHGRIVTVDISDMSPSRATRPQHDRIVYLTGSSTSADVVAEVRRIVEGAETVMVILDSDHTRDHVVTELKIYSEFVTPGSYVIVEDTNVNGHPVFPAHGPGPMEAVDLFLKESRSFAPDRGREKHLVTASPKGFLKRVVDGGTEARLLEAQAVADAKDREISDLTTDLLEAQRVGEARGEVIKHSEADLLEAQRVVEARGEVIKHFEADLVEAQRVVEARGEVIKHFEAQYGPLDAPRRRGRR